MLITGKNALKTPAHTDIANTFFFSFSGHESIVVQHHIEFTLVLI